MSLENSNVTKNSENVGVKDIANDKKKKKQSQENSHQYNLKVPKGTKDWFGKDMVLRSAIFDTIVDVFKRHGGVTLDTPAFELKEILAGKYGEDSKLIYDLKDQGGEICSLRYDLTVPFARFLAMNPTIIPIKRYHIAKVYRRDQPAMSKGRMREFYQCDFDIAGSYESMIPDAEILNICIETLTKLGINDFHGKINHRKILDGIFQVAGVPLNDVRKISSAVDKLDKLSWEDVKKEMVLEKGLDEKVADKIGNYVKIKGDGFEVLEILKNDKDIMQNQSAAEGISEMESLFNYTQIYGINNKLVLDMSLARGLDYYTGLIYEFVVASSAPPSISSLSISDSKNKKKENSKNKTKDIYIDKDDNSENVGVGSIAAGGRYDNLVGMFASNKKNGQIPCIGISFGVERIFSIIKASSDYNRIRFSYTDVYVMAFGGGKEWTGFLPERMKIAKLLWDSNIKAEFLYKSKPKPRQQFDAADKNGAPFAVILGQEEYENGIVKVKELNQGDSSNDGVDVKIENLVEYLQKKIVQHGSSSELLESLKL